MIKKEAKTVSVFDGIKRFAGLFIPPIVIKGAWFVKNNFIKTTLEYAPAGWQTQLNNSRNKGWNVDSVIDTEKIKWANFCRNLKGARPLGFSHEHTDLSEIRNPNFHNVHISYAYVLALAAHKKDRISVLDWGGALGHYYQVGRAVLPDVDIDFHVKEVPMMVQAGKMLNPDVGWYDDESCLDRDYDLIMITGSLPYIQDWAELLQRISDSVNEYLYVARLPIVEHGPSFLAIQRIYNSQMLHQQLNQTAFLEAVKKTGLALVREFVVGDRPYIKGAPEQCEIRGWLFKKEAASSL